MRDPILKRLFGHAEVVEVLIRDILPEDARRIDLSTLEKLGTEFVGEALVRRYPDMMWTARTRDGTGRVVILVEFQGQPDRLMPLRTAIYSHLAVQEMLRRARPAPRPDSIEVLPPIVIYHGRGAWKGPTALGELFPRGIPREFRVIFRDPAESESGTAAGLVGAIASLDRDTSMAGTLAELGRLKRVASESGDRLDRLLANCIGAWLVSKRRITEEQNREVTTMTEAITEYERSLEEFGRDRWREGRAEGRAEAITEYERSLEEFGRERWREGRAEGRAEAITEYERSLEEFGSERRREGRVEVLCRLVGRRFGADTAERLAGLFGTPADDGRLARAESAVLECSAVEELLRRVKG